MQHVISNGRVEGGEARARYEYDDGLKPLREGRSAATATVAKRRRRRKGREQKRLLLMMLAAAC